MVHPTPRHANYVTNSNSKKKLKMRMKWNYTKHKILLLANTNI